MPSVGTGLIDLYPYRIENGFPQFLLLKRASKKIYAGQWRMVGGKVKKGENAWAAALRELKEETGLSPKIMWTVPTLNHFYEAGSDTLHLIPAFAAEVDPASDISMDDEHSEFQWVSAETAIELLPWPEQCRIVCLADELIKKDKILNQWLTPSENS
ncbi:MAG: NUDIX domain-containing protein [Balneolaceae bacterium]